MEHQSAPALDDGERALLLLDHSRRLAGFGTWERNLLTGEGVWSEEHREMLGLAADEPTPSLDEWLQWVDLDDRAAIHEAHRRVAAAEDAHSDVTFRVTLRDGERRVLRATVFRVPGRPLVLGITQDITAEASARADANCMRAVLASAIEAVPQPVIIRDSNGRALWWNAPFEALTGWTPEEILRSTRGDFVHPDDRAAFLAWTEAATFRTGEASTIAPTFRVVRSDGEVRYYQPTPGAVIRLHDQEIFGVVRTGRDVTDEVRAQRAASAHTAEAEWMLEATPTPLVLVDRHGGILRCNAAFEETVGWPRAELRGQHLSRLLVEGTPFAALLEEMAATPSPASADPPRILHLRRRDGSGAPVSVTLRPMGSEDRRPAVLVTFLDATYAAKAMEQVHALQRHEAIGTLVAGVAHDFNNLLTGILGPLHMLQGDPLERRWLDLAVEATERAVPLARQLLDYARPGADEPGEVDLARVAADVISLFQVTSDRRVGFRLRGGEDPLIVRATAPGVQQVLINLLANARDAVIERLDRDADGEPGMVEVTLRGLAGKSPRVEVRIEDNGTGIPARIRERIFEPFFTTKRNGKGAGVGLSASRSLVLQWGGSISLDSPPGRGAVFTIELPAAPTAAAVEPTSAPPSGERPLQGLRVLLVDDDPAVLVYAEYVLGTHGASVVAVSSAEEALTLLGGAIPDVVVFDLNMPELNGWAFLDRARAIVPGARMVVLSGHVDNEEQRLHRPNAVVWKPYRPAHLVQAVLGVR